MFSLPFFDSEGSDHKLSVLDHDLREFLICISFGIKGSIARDSIVLGIVHLILNGYAIQLSCAFNRLEENIDRVVRLGRQGRGGADP